MSKSDSLAIPVCYSSMSTTGTFTNEILILAFTIPNLHRGLVGRREFSLPVALVVLDSVVRDVVAGHVSKIHPQPKFKD